MAFWGVELRPGSPYTHRYQHSRGRLRITQAALVNSDVNTRTVVQCSLGNRRPLILCTLYPRLAEMCHLDVEFEEDVGVLLSVVGPSSVHLSGYYLQSSRSNNNIARYQQSSESEDIGESDSEYLYESVDRYESDFIDDGDVEASDKEYVSDSMDDGYICSSHDHHKPAFEKHSRKVELHRLLQQKLPADNSDDNTDDYPYMPTVKHNRHSLFYSSNSSEDEGLFIRSEILESLRKNVTSNDEIEKESNDARKRKCGAINHDPAAPTEVIEVNVSLIPEPELEKQKKSKQTSLEPEDGKHSISNNIRTLKGGLIIEDLSAGNRDGKVASKGNKVYINYVGKLQDGKIVHSNAGKKSYKFMLGAGEVICGWDRGIIGMRVGDKRRLTIPPSLWRHRWC